MLSGVRRSCARSAVICLRSWLACARSALIWLNDVASSPISSRERTVTRWSSLPRAIAWVAAVSSRIGRVSVRASSTPRISAINAAIPALIAVAQVTRSRKATSGGGGPGRFGRSFGVAKQHIADRLAIHLDWRCRHPAWPPVPAARLGWRGCRAQSRPRASASATPRL